MDSKYGSADRRARPQTRERRPACGVAFAFWFALAAGSAALASGMRMCELWGRQ